MNEYLAPIIRRSLENINTSNTVRGADGRLCCAVCGGEREAVLDDGTIVGVPCSCLEARMQDEAKEKELRDRIAGARRDLKKLGALCDPAYEVHSFQKDQRPETSASRLSRGYVARFAEMRNAGLGLLFSGFVGTGKSFLAASIVNELRDKHGYRTVILSTARLISGVRSSQEPQTLLDNLHRFDLIALDDLGAERATDFGLEIVESVVDARALRGLPLIVTTNMSIKQLSAPSDLRYARIFDRLKILCPKIIALTGDSMRGERGKAQAKLMDELLRDES